MLHAWLAYFVFFLVSDRKAKGFVREMFYQNVTSSPQLLAHCSYQPSRTIKTRFFVLNASPLQTSATLEFNYSLANIMRFFLWPMLLLSVGPHSLFSLCFVCVLFSLSLSLSCFFHLIISYITLCTAFVLAADK